MLITIFLIIWNIIVMNMYIINIHYPTLEITEYTLLRSLDCQVNVAKIWPIPAWYENRLYIAEEIRLVLLNDYESVSRLHLIQVYWRIWLAWISELMGTVAKDQISTFTSIEIWLQTFSFYVWAPVQLAIHHNFADTFCVASTTWRAPCSPEQSAPSMYPFHSGLYSVPTKWILPTGLP